jgi:hypothetical protein
MEDFYMTFITKKPHNQIIIMKHTVVSSLIKADNTAGLRIDDFCRY